MKQVPLLSKLARSKTLRALSLRRNALGDEGFRHLLVALTRSKSLCSLDVSENLITNKSLPMIAEFLGRPSICGSFLEECPSVKEINLSGYTMQLEQADNFCKLSELSQCALLVSVESLYLCFRFIISDARLEELRKGAEAGLGVLLRVCGEVLQNCELSECEESLQCYKESSQYCKEPSPHCDEPFPHNATQPATSHSLAEPVRSIQAFLEKLPPEEAEKDSVLSSLVASLPDLLRFLKTPSVALLASHDE